MKAPGCAGWARAEPGTNGASPSTQAHPKVRRGRHRHPSKLFAKTCFKPEVTLSRKQTKRKLLASPCVRGKQAELPKLNSNLSRAFCTSHANQSYWLVQRCTLGMGRYMGLLFNIRTAHIKARAVNSLIYRHLVVISWRCTNRKVLHILSITFKKRNKNQTKPTNQHSKARTCRALLIHLSAADQIIP